MRLLRIPLREPFVTSYGAHEYKEAVIVELQTCSGAAGFAECTALAHPLYTEETTTTAWHVIRDFLLPRVWNTVIEQAADLHQLRDKLAAVRGNRMAKAAVEMACWDAFAQEQGIPLHVLLGGTRQEVETGVSLGIQPDQRTLLEKVERSFEQGYKRVKLKIAPGCDVEPIRAIREALGPVPLMADANSAYALADVERLRELDPFGLLMVEQPLAWDDLIDHAVLQRSLSTPVCLDESIVSAAAARQALDIGACRIVNLKVGRVGGFSEAVAVHDICVRRPSPVPLWCGGMLETGIGRLHNIALASLPGFTLPGDTSPSDRYFAEDLVDPPVTFSRPGVIPVEPVCGVAERVRRDRLERWTVREEAVGPAE
ncbi:MAG: o-succinylbenzoate synthase [Alicyclobacillaceae bacterium]|nr:o-succinylbenzoate synthase [Alicyclobacillaceae bacterium]